MQREYEVINPGCRPIGQGKAPLINERSLRRMTHDGESHHGQKGEEANDMMGKQISHEKPATLSSGKIAGNPETGNISNCRDKTAGSRNMRASLPGQGHRSRSRA